jgi:2-polyprenyl-3-methyl-5-hydroxy-6-metoxy-1,4-benzoquinol methylase
MAKGTLVNRLRGRVRRELRDVAPGRRLRVRLATSFIEQEPRQEGPTRVLDAGSEEGLLCLELARRHPDFVLVAADWAEAPLHRGRAWAEAEGLDVHFVRCDLQRFLAQDCFDVVVALESLVEIPDDRAALRNLATAVRPGGLLLVQVPTADWTPVLGTADRTWRREARHGYDAEELRAALDDLGFEVTRTLGTFRRGTALAQDVRDRWKGRGRWVQLLMLPVMAGAVRLELAGVGWGPPRAYFVVARRNSEPSAS